MSTPSVAVRDSATMLRRNLRHMQRYPSLTVMLVGIPVVFLLLFVYVLGATLGAGLGGASRGRAGYVEYLVPGILLITVASGVQGTAISVAMDMSEGIIDRFRTMAISRGAVLTGHVVASVIQTIMCMAVVLGVALLIGFRATAGFVEWMAAAGVLAMTALAFAWLSVALGLGAKSVETASNAPMPLILLPFLGSGFVPSATLSAGMRWFAQYQPFTPIIETVRGLLTGTPIGNRAVLAVAWCAAISLVGYLRARFAYEHQPAR